ncbi:MAG: double-strand break repair Rad50 ATPase [Gemmataceae bacterium]|nr:double-strand break repair Rad50 ATPase [Gemmataceae bacterium]
MIPKRVTLENFLSFGPKTEIAFSDDEPLWVLGGPNGVGKSAVFDAITYCLFGAHRGGAKEIDPLVRHGTNGFSVSFEFEFGGVDYRITRNRTGGKTTQAVEQRKPGVEKWDRVPNVNSVPSVREWAERTLGLGFDAFKASVLLRQGEADAIIAAGGTERLKILKKIIGAEQFEDLSKRVHESARVKQSRRDDLAVKMAAADEVPEADRTAAAAAVESATRARDTADRARAEAGACVSLARQWVDWEKARREVAEKIAAADTRAAGAEEIRRAKRRLDDLSAVLPTLKQLVPLRISVVAEERRLGDAQDTDAQATARRDDLTRWCEGLRLRIAAHRDAAAGHAKQANDLRTRIGQQRKFLTAADAIAGLKKQLSDYDPNLDARAADASRAHAEAVAAERAANDALTTIATLLGEVKKEQARFASIETGVPCSRCGQLVSAEHAETERRRIADAISALTGQHETAADEMTAAANGLGSAEKRSKELARQVNERDGLRQRLTDQSHGLESLGGTSDAAQLREAIAHLTTDAAGSEQKRDAERISQDQTQEALGRVEAELSTATAGCAKLAADLAALERRVVADRAKLDTLSAQLPEPWRVTTAEQLTGYTAELDSLTASRTTEQFRQLENDAVCRGEWGQQLSDTLSKLDGIPESARIPVAEAERLEAEARTEFIKAEWTWQEARDAFADLTRRTAEFEKLRRELAAAEADARVHGRLDELLGRKGLQLVLIADAQREIVRLAHDTVKNLSDGDLSIELDGSADGSDEAFALLVRRADDPTPIGVNYLSGSQKFRVAISVALAIGRFAAGQARPLECVIIDEGFGSLDKEGLRFAAEELNRLKQYLRRIVLVSHQDEFTEHFPVVIQLTKGENGTTARTVRK